ncbi:MAG: DUF4406 domain-containing protein [Acidovorax sp.]|jgi:hypothetical protein|nr:DUF4406 domain-containing protein [Acidovorax sp.]
MYMMIFRAVLMPAMVFLSFFTGWRMAHRVILDECQRLGGFFVRQGEFHCMSTLQMWLMHESPHQRVYIAGPMSGIDDLNYPAFNETAARLRNKGWHVENPAENPAPHVEASCHWTAYMRMGISQLMTCHAIYLLPGWQQSKGASLEYLIAQRLGLKVMHHHQQEDVLQGWLSDVMESTPPMKPAAAAPAPVLPDAIPIAAPVATPGKEIKPNEFQDHIYA